jgi:hypothetical protein
MVRYRSLEDLPPQARKQAEKALAGWNQPAANDARFERPARPRKYGNVPVIQDGRRFDSKIQARRNRQLRLQVATGEIKGFISEVSVRLPSGNRMRLDELVNQPMPHECWKCGAENLIATLVLEDTKGLITPAWKAKCAELEAALGVKVRIYKGG